MRHRLPHRRLAAAVLLALALWSSPARGQTTRPASRPATGPSGLAVHEWAVFVYDGLSTQLNEDGPVTSGLPPFVPTRRRTTDGAAPTLSPVGVIRLSGDAGGPVDVSLSRGGGQLVASWPRAQDRASGVLWRNLTVQPTPGGDGLVGTEAASIVGRLRASGGPYTVDGKGGCEPFLLYDAELPFTCPLTVEASAAGVRATNTGAVALHDLTLFRQTPAGWTAATVGDLPAAARPSTRRSTGPSTGPATRPATPLAAAPAGTPAGLAADWVRDRLGPAGPSDGDRRLVADLVAKYGFDGGRLTAVYRLDAADMDRLLPLEVLPQPRRVDRVGVVLLRDIDPAAGTDVDDLIARLGDPSWSTREAASAALAALGPTATAKLRAASHAPDVEVAWRAERLLAAGEAR